MKKLQPLFLLTTLSLLIAPLAGGCALGVLAAAGAAGAGTYAYVEGKSSQTFHGSYDQVYNSTVNAVRGLNMQVVKEQRDPVAGGGIDARTADNKDVTISFKPIDSTSTQVTVRVGKLPDEAANKRVLDRIQTTLASR